MYFKGLQQALWGLFGLSLILSTDIQANGTVVSDKHYISYKISSAKNNIPFKNVTLKDQFIPSPRDFILNPAQWLLTPATKITQDKDVFPNHSPVHYVGYRINTAQPFFYDFTVNVYNQFGVFTLNAFTPEYLLVPSLKVRAPKTDFNFIVVPDTFASAIDTFAISDILQSANHYLCYKTNVQQVSSQFFGYLYDQFHPRNAAGHGTRPYHKLFSAHLCNPVIKSHDGRTYDIIDQDTHYMCFDFEPQFGYNYLGFKVLNQFGRGQGEIYSDDELCVPSSKYIVEDLCDGSLTNNGVCNGACDNGYICQPNGQTGSCHCIPTGA